MKAPQSPPLTLNSCHLIILALCLFGDINVIMLSYHYKAKHSHYFLLDSIIWALSDTGC